MEFLLKFLGEQWLVGAVQMVLSKSIKPQLQEKLLAGGMKATGILPLLNVFVAMIGFQVLPASAHAAGVVGELTGIGSTFGLALLQTVMVTGTHSTLKNTVGPAAKITLGWLAERLLKALGPR